MATHELKTWPDEFVAVIHGEKRHEIRKTDRDFAVSDTLRLREYRPTAGGSYTGREASYLVTYLTRGGAWGLPADLCVMSLSERL
jgi:ParB family chromosome partitioning protein